MKNTFNIDNAYSIMLEKITSWVETFISMLPNMVLCLLLLIAFWLLAKLAQSITLKLSRRISDNIALNKLLGTIIFILTLGLGFFIALSVLKLNKAVTSLLAGAGVVGLALGFAFQDSAANFISGIFMAARRPFKIGDMIGTGDQLGIVHKMNLRNTIIHSFQGQEIIIPNKEVYQNTLINYTSLQERRVDISVGVSYSDDLEKAKNIAVKAIEDTISYRRKDKEVELFYNEFGNSSINFSLRFWVDFPDQPGFLKAQSDAVIAIKKAFDKNNITIPFPIRTLDINTDQLNKILNH